MILLSGVLVCALAAGAAAAIVSAEPAVTEANVVDTTAEEPVFLSAVCFIPTREALAEERASCDQAAEDALYQHGVLRPSNANDDIGIVQCPPPTGEGPTAKNPETYVCLGVGQPSVLAADANQ